MKSVGGINMKKFVIALLVVILAFSVFACAGTETPDEDVTQESAAQGDAAQDEVADPETTEKTTGENFWEVEGSGRTIGLTIISFASGAWSDLADSCEKYTRPGDKLVALSFDEDSEELTRIMEDMVTKQYDAIAFTAHDPDAVMGPMEQAADAGIPLFNIDSPAEDKDAIVTYIGTDNYQAGFDCGEMLAKAINYEGKIAQWSSSDTSVAVALYDRSKGFEDAIAQYEGIEIVAKPETTWPWNVDNAMSSVEAMLQANPNIDGFFVPADILLDGVVQAFENANIENPNIVSISTREKYPLIENGSIYGIIDVQYDLVGKTIMESIYKYYDGETLDATIYSPAIAVTRENISEFI